MLRPRDIFFLKNDYKTIFLKSFDFIPKILRLHQV